MKKLEFTWEMFNDLVHPEGPSPENYAARANALLAEMKKEMQVFYGYHGDDGIWCLSTSLEFGDTHKLTVFEIEPIEKKPCEHEPPVNVDPGRFGAFIPINDLKCKHCGKKLKAKWSVADE